MSCQVHAIGKAIRPLFADPVTNNVAIVLVAKTHAVIILTALPIHIKQHVLSLVSAITKSSNCNYISRVHNIYMGESI